jgi:predicted amidohydrolase YtcJ
VTLNDQQPSAQAFAVKNGEIVAVGSENGMRSWTGPKTEQIFLNGKTLMPGFIDGHMVNGGVQAIAANLLPPPDVGVDSIAALQQVLKDWIAKSPISKKYGLIIGFGYDDSQLKEKRHPTKEELDAVSKDIPIMCFHQSGHIVSYNSKALEMAGITSQTKDPVGGVIQLKAGSQESNGVFEKSAMLLIGTKILPKVGTEEMFNLAMAGSDNPTTMYRTKIADVKVLKTIKEGKTIYELKPTTQSKQNLSCMESPKCQGLIANPGPQSSFSEFLPHNHNH